MDAGEPDDAGGPGDGGSVTTLPPPDQAGPYAVTVTSGTFMHGTDAVPYDLNVPQQPSATRAPVVLFLPGFQLADTDYPTIVSRIASHGFIVVGATPPASLTSANHVAMAQDSVALMQALLGTNGALARVGDSSRQAVMGHSLGGKIAMMVAASDSSISLYFGIDPVNGGSPFSGFTTTQPNIVPGDVTPLTYPLAFVGETTDGTSSSALAPACAPLSENFQTFYDAATGSSWRTAWTYGGAAHLDFVDTPGVLASACTPGTAQPADVRSATATLATAFLRKFFLSDPNMDPYLTGAAVPVAITTQHSP